MLADSKRVRSHKVRPIKDCHSSIALYRSSMERIVIDPDICNGQPVVRGTRISAQTVLEFLAAGDSIEGILEEYPSLSREDVLACIGLSSNLMKHHFLLQEVA